MASVTIDSGQLPSAEGKDGYALTCVIARWQSIACGSFREDCQALLQMIDETDRLRLWEKKIGGFKYENRDEFLQHSVLIDYDLTEQSLGQIVARLRQGETVGLTLRQHGGDRRSEKARDQGCNATLKRGTATYTLARLDRDNPELAEDVRAGRKSANAAAIEAGFRKKPSPLDALNRAWAKASPDERQQFLAHIRDC